MLSNEFKKIKTLVSAVFSALSTLLFHFEVLFLSWSQIWQLIDIQGGIFVNLSVISYIDYWYGSCTLNKSVVIWGGKPAVIGQPVFRIRWNTKVTRPQSTTYFLYLEMHCKASWLNYNKSVTYNKSIRSLFQRDSSYWMVNRDT